jgi:hypothetical protein
MKKSMNLLFFFLLPSREKVGRKLRSFYKTAGMRGCPTQTNDQPYPSPVTHFVSATLSLKGRGEGFMSC